MRRVKARNKQEKCKYKRCMSKRVENARYCIKHMDVIQFAGGDGFGKLMYKGKELEMPLETKTAIMYYTVVNGKCAWCGKDADKLSQWHFRRHDLWQRFKALFFVDNYGSSNKG